MSGIPIEPCVTCQRLYQPISFSIGTNGVGTKAELQSLCDEAEKYGIKIIVDVVANHLRGDHNNIDNDLKPYEYWHTFGGGIDWKNRWQVTHGTIGMPDIATENPYVQQKVCNYVQELKSVGVDGLRCLSNGHRDHREFRRSYKGRTVLPISRNRRPRSERQCVLQRPNEVRQHLPT